MDFQQRLANPRERVYLPELFAEVVKQKSNKAKSDLLNAYAKKNAEHFETLRDFIQCTFHPAVVMDLPDTEPPYETTFPDYNLAPNTLHKVFKRVPYFVKGHSKYIAEKVKREKLYIQTLESLYKPDAELFLMVKDKQIDQTKYRGLTEKLFRETFPELLPGKEDVPKQTGS